MNKTQKALAMLLIIAAVVFVAGCASQSSQSKTTDSTATLTLKDATAQDKEWINNTKNNIALVQQTDTLYKNELERDGATYISKYNKAKDVENIAMQAAGISQQATVSQDLRPVKDNYENYLTHLRLYAAWKAKAWDSVNSEGSNTQNMDYGQSGQIEEEDANKYLDKYNSGMSEYLKSHRV